MALPATRLSCLSLLIYVILISFVSADRLLNYPNRDENTDFTTVPSPPISDIVGEDNTCLNPRINRLMVSRKQLTLEFKSQLTEHGITLSKGEVEQKISVNLQTGLKVFPRENPYGLTVKIPCVVPLVEFKYNYIMNKQSRHKKTGTLLVQIFDRPLQMEVVAIPEKDGSCSIKWMKLKTHKQLKNYKLHTTFNPDSKYDMTPVQTAINKLATDGWPYSEYRAQIKAFIFMIVKEAVMQNHRVIQHNDLLSKTCPVFKDPPSPIEVPTTPTPPRPTFRPEPTTRTPVWTTQEPGPEIPTPSPPNPGQDCKPINIEVHYNKKKQS